MEMCNKIIKNSFWELDMTDIYRPTETKECCPSDCRYRPDLIALSEGNVPLADSEKVGVETIQRNDKSLRQKFINMK